MDVKNRITGIVIHFILCWLTLPLAKMDVHWQTSVFFHVGCLVFKLVYLDDKDIPEYFFYSCLEKTIWNDVWNLFLSSNSHPYPIFLLFLFYVQTIFILTGKLQNTYFSPAQGFHFDGLVSNINAFIGLKLFFTHLTGFIFHQKFPYELFFILFALKIVDVYRPNLGKIHSAIWFFIYFLPFSLDVQNTCKMFHLGLLSPILLVCSYWKYFFKRYHIKYNTYLQKKLPVVIEKDVLKQVREILDTEPIELGFLITSFLNKGAMYEKNPGVLLKLVNEQDGFQQKFKFILYVIKKCGFGGLRKPFFDFLKEKFSFTIKKPCLFHKLQHKSDWDYCILKHRY